jgi:hypothetical protein
MVVHLGAAKMQALFNEVIDQCCPDAISGLLLKALPLDIAPSYFRELQILPIKGLSRFCWNERNDLSFVLEHNICLSM